MSEEFLFQDDPEPSSHAIPGTDGLIERPPWVLLVVDDEPSVHQVTKLALRDMVYDGRGLSILSAHSAAEARKVLDETPGVAVILLDVVMETDHAGLDLARYIRQDLGNLDVRIVLRTGQPGQAPEMEIIADYDINDYKDKTELTAQKLYTLMLACLRSYRDIEILHNSRIGLQHVIEAARGILQQRGADQFVAATVEYLKRLLNLTHDVVYLFDVTAYRYDSGRFSMLSSGEGAADSVAQLLADSYRLKENQLTDYDAVVYCRGRNRIFLFHLHSPRLLTPLDQNLLNLLVDNLNIALENIDLNEKVRFAQQDIISRMGAMVETHTVTRGTHVRRVAQYAELLARLTGMSEDDVDLLRRSAPLHDVGKVAIPDRVLNKPGPLDNDEWALMQTHAERGYQMLAGTGQPLLDTGAIISRSHHERWNGSGYPKGLKGEEIPLVGRIIALADVFDALGSERCYNGQWEVGAIVAYIEARSGQDFDPRLVSLFRDNLPQFLAIRNQLSDQKDSPVLTE